MSLIKCQNVSLNYGSHRALNSLSFTVESKGPVALVGPNGAGKTSLFSCLCGYQSPDSGTIEILGHTPGSPALAGRLAALPQDAKLDARFSVKAQLVYFARLQGLSAKAADDEAMRVLALVDLTGIAGKLPSELSHGMNKRVSIAQALLGQPELVLLDEPTAGLDPANTKAIRELIKQLAGQTQFMISSHNLDELEKLCTSVLYIDKGELTKSMAVESQSSEISYLTLKMARSDDKALFATLTALPGVEQVEQTASGEFVLQTSPRQGHHLEIAVLNALADNGWQYRLLLNGRTLEDSLFSSSS